jgi:hypothetical protein
MKAIKKIEEEREARRAKMKAEKALKDERKVANQLAGKGNIDVDFEMMVDANK